MKKIFLILLSFSFSSFIIAQQIEKINLFLDDSGEIPLETNYQHRATSQQFQNWISSLPENVTGKIVYNNSNSGEFRFKGCVPIFFKRETYRFPD
ncbi:hypothetical protein [Labilibaculum antarcticum]|uniref:hypothetical protein n=1 Tax=Labilibaculum antarcticum TaxID=1717717 RepID=UPI000BBAB23F|nr:hypothetical protein [Labilibaculum antarcticum]